MRKTSVLSEVFVLTLLPFLISAVAGVQFVTAAEDSRLASAPIHDEHFVVQKVLGGFAGTVCVGSFNASNGYWVELNIASFSNDPYEVIVKITSANHGEIFHARGSTFTQTVSLYYEDSYNITIAKHAFYSTVTVSGKIDVYHGELPAPTPTQIPSPTASPTPTVTPYPTLDPTITPSPSPAPSQEPTSNTQSGPLPPIVVTVSAVSIAVIGVYLLVYFKKRKN
jgi:hypothetical protein